MAGRNDNTAANVPRDYAELRLNPSRQQDSAHNEHGSTEAKSNDISAAPRLKLRTSALSTFSHVVPQRFEIG